MRPVCTSTTAAAGASLLLMLLLAVAAPPALGAEGAPGWAQELWHELMSPYCPGRTLVDCPSGEAAKLRGWIQEQERAGLTKEEVEQQLYVRFGDGILQAPRVQGFGLAAYVIPVVAFLAGGAVVVLFLSRQAGRREEAAPPELAAEELRAAPADSELERLVDEELGRG